ncbi:DUF520 family protein, partial [bacterium]|nr:DUF520 family protein [bacterium]
MDVFALSASREMPYSLSADDRRDGLARTHYFFKSVLNVDRILFIKEIGIHKHYRSTQAPSLVNPLFRFATSKNVKAFLFEKEERASGNSLRQTVKLKNGIEQEIAKEIIKDIKDQKIKVQSSIRGDEVRIEGKNRD